MSSDLPIGIFDSGIGGLTVVRQIHKLMPNEELVYLGDTARVPYGTKAPSTVVRFACEDTQFLLQQNVKAVVVACGAIHTAALLLRSGLDNEHIGRHLHLHPVSNVCGVFEEEIRPWEGTMQAIYSDEFRQMTGNYGVKFETTALQPVIAQP